jgi:hypothetical protein
MPWTRIDFALWVALAITWVVAAPFARSTVRRESAASRVRYIAEGVVVFVLMEPNVFSTPWLDAR